MFSTDREMQFNDDLFGKKNWTRAELKKLMTLDEKTTSESSEQRDMPRRLLLMHPPPLAWQHSQRVRRRLQAFRCLFPVPRKFPCAKHMRHEKKPRHPLRTPRENIQSGRASVTGIVAWRAPAGGRHANEIARRVFLSMRTLIRNSTQPRRPLALDAKSRERSIG